MILFTLFLCDAMECFVRWRLGCMLAVVYDERDQVLPEKNHEYLWKENAQAQYGDLDIGI